MANGQSLASSKVDGWLGVEAGRYKRVKQVFMAALDLPEKDRERFLLEACGGDEDLRREVLDLMAVDEPRTETKWQAPAMSAEPHPSSYIERQLGPYRLIRELGRGGMGMVFLAEQTEPVRRRVAIKLIKTDSPSHDTLTRFHSERQAMAMMNHARIAKVFDAGTSPQGYPYFVMEYVPGRPMTTFCDDHRHDILKRLHLFLMVCDGVLHAHQRGIIHRDLKPANILVTLENKNPVPVIIDFGIAKATLPRLTPETLLTMAGVLVGTPGHMSPEQVSSEGEIDIRTDVYALGVVLYQLLSGNLPFDFTNKSVYEMLETVIHGEPPTMVQRLQSQESLTVLAEARSSSGQRLLRLLTGDLQHIVDRAMAKEKAERYPTVQALADDLLRYIEGRPVEASAPTSVQRVLKWTRRNKAMAISAAVACLGVISGVILLGWGLLAARKAEGVAVREAAKVQTMNQFLVGLLGAPTPFQEGLDVKVIDILDKALEQLNEGTIEDPEVEINLRSSLYEVFLNRSDYDRAYEIMTQNYTVSRKKLGDNHETTFQFEVELALFEILKGIYQEPERKLKDSLRRQRIHLAKGHQQIRATIHTLGMLYNEQERWDEAAVQLEMVLAMVKQDGIAEERWIDEDIVSYLESYAKTLDGQGNDEKELTVRKKILDLSTQAFGADHAETLVRANEYVSALVTTSPREALKLGRENLAKARLVFGADDFFLYAILQVHARLHRFNQLFEESLPYSEEAHRIAVKNLGFEHVRVFYIEEVWVQDLIRLGRYDDVLTLCERRFQADEPDNYYMWFHLARGFSWCGRHDRVLELSPKLFKLGKGKGPEQLYVALALLESDQPQKAKDVVAGWQLATWHQAQIDKDLRDFDEVLPTTWAARLRSRRDEPKQSSP